MAEKQDAYQVIAEMWTFPESKSFRKMIEAMFTLEEAEMLLAAREPITIPELAKKLKKDEKFLAEKYDNFAKRGLIYRGPTQYHFRRGVHFSASTVARKREGVYSQCISSPEAWL